MHLAHVASPTQCTSLYESHKALKSAATKRQWWQYPVADPGGGGGGKGGATPF